MDLLIYYSSIYFPPSKFCGYYLLTSFHFSFGFMLFEKSLYYEFNSLSEGGKSRYMCLIFRCCLLVLAYITNRKLLLRCFPGDPKARKRRGGRIECLVESGEDSLMHLSTYSLGIGGPANGKLICKVHVSPGQYFSDHCQCHPL